MPITLETVAELPSRGDARTVRITFPGGRATTAHVARYPLATTRVRLLELEPPRALQQWCAEGGVEEALNGGFFTKPEFHPLGELRIDGSRRRCRDFEQPWDQRRGAIHVAPDGAVAFGPRRTFGDEPAGDLLQAGPLLVADGEVLVAQEDPEGLSSTCHEFDSDITAEPLPRSAIGVTADAVLAISVDGRGDHDDGLLLHELAAVLVELGAVHALNLDGGSSSSLVTGGERRNCPRDNHGDELVDGYPTPCALLFDEL